MPSRGFWWSIPTGSRQRSGPGFQKAGCRVVVSNSGTAALQRLASADIDAVVLDADVTNPQLPYLLPQLRSDMTPDAHHPYGKPQQVPQLEDRMDRFPAWL